MPSSANADAVAPSSEQLEPVPSPNQRTCRFGFLHKSPRYTRHRWHAIWAQSVSFPEADTGFLHPERGRERLVSPRLISHPRQHPSQVDRGTESPGSWSTVCATERTRRKGLVKSGWAPQLGQLPVGKVKGRVSQEGS